MSTRAWAETGDDGGFGLANLPYGIFTRSGGPPRAGVRIGDRVLDLAGLAAAGLVEDRGWFAAGSLNAFMAAGRAAWAANRARLTELLGGEAHRADVEPHLVPLGAVELARPFEVADYVDFYSSEHHAANVGRMFRPQGEPLLPNWKRLPVGYHGRAGTVYPSGTPVVRPCGQRRVPGQDEPGFGPSLRLDIEAEVGFVAGVPSAPGRPVAVDAFRDHVFGFVLVNDWSARDVQQWEAQPLGPFLSKSFATSVSPWVVPVAALEAARVAPPAQDPAPLPYLRTAEPWGLDLRLEVLINGGRVAEPPFREMYWTSPQQLAHATVNGAPLRTGDLFASGTVSGPGRGQRGCLLELTWNGAEPVTLADGSARAFLEDGDTVTIRGTAPGPDGAVIGLGEVTGTVLPATC
ncbi:fumarylacetoacetase [Actinomadura parmotrematis]|uniref:fumarylacetoacetase n=1 Tax=Actinomadura parmotrematis TaxID=2864039 RepID=A0ABS7FYP5_9ACTN|nr:fumarylacetoacetase [Actinomadura parmotrematis]MBW8485396.1 fumarylacetoacetase [Actinomadura parmotrematis]